METLGDISSLKKSNRILVLGCSGSGKSTITRVLSQKYGLPPIHLDVHFWQANWIETPEDEWREKVKSLVQAEKWLMDGTFSESFDIRFPLADAIIILNLPRTICLYRAILRVFKYNKVKRRPDMAMGCDESFDFSFYKYIWTFNRKEYPKIMKAVESHRVREKVVTLNSNKEVKNFIGNLD